MWKKILLFAGILLVLYLVDWWVVEYSSFTIAENTSLPINGLVILVIQVGVIVLLIRSLLKVKPETSIGKLVGLGIATCVLAEILFQAARQFTFENYTPGDRLFYFIQGVIGMAIFGGIFSFLVAFEIKTKKSWVTFLLVVALLALSHFIKYRFPSFFE